MSSDTKAIVLFSSSTLTSAVAPLPMMQDSRAECAVLEMLATPNSEREQVNQRIALTLPTTLLLPSDANPLVCRVILLFVQVPCPQEENETLD